MYHLTATMYHVKQVPCTICTIWQVPRTMLQVLFKRCTRCYVLVLLLPCCNDSKLDILWRIWTSLCEMLSKWIKHETWHQIWHQCKPMRIYQCLSVDMCSVQSSNLGHLIKEGQVNSTVQRSAQNQRTNQSCALKQCTNSVHKISSPQIQCTETVHKFSVNFSKQEQCTNSVHKVSAQI